MSHNYLFAVAMYLTLRRFINYCKCLDENTGFCKIKCTREFREPVRLRNLVLSSFVKRSSWCFFISRLIYTTIFRKCTTSCQPVQICLLCDFLKSADDDIYFLHDSSNFEEFCYVFTKYLYLSLWYGY